MVEKIYCTLGLTAQKLYPQVYIDVSKLIELFLAWYRCFQGNSQISKLKRVSKLIMFPSGVSNLIITLISSWDGHFR